MRAEDPGRFGRGRGALFLGYGLYKSQNGSSIWVSCWRHVLGFLHPIFGLGHGIGGPLQTALELTNP